MENLNSILTSIKKLLGISEDDTHFDMDIIVHINSVFMDLNQIGVGPPEGFTIKDEKSIWTNFITDTTKVEALKSYIYLRVKLLFDPPQSSAVIASMERQIDKLEFRLNIAAENTEIVDTESEVESQNE